MSKEFDVRADSRKRISIKVGAGLVFHVIVKKDGSIVAKPVDVTSAPSAKAVEMIERSIKSLKAGKRGSQVDLKELAAMKL